MGSIISVIATALFIYIIFEAYTESSQNKVEKNPWSIASFFVTRKEIEDATPCATTLEFSVISPTPIHAYDVLPILTDTRENLPLVL